MKELFDLIAARRRASHVPYALATVIRVEGSSYRRPGARMLISVHGRVAGSVSGGCLEKAVIAAGRSVLLDGSPRLLAFDTTDQDDVFGASLGCQGKVWIGLEVLPANVRWNLEAIAVEVLERREPVVLVTRIIRASSTVRFESSTFPSDGTNTASLVLPKTCKTQYVQDDFGNGFLMEWLTPPLNLWLFGDGPDVTPMIRLARGLGHEVTVIIGRPGNVATGNFTGAQKMVVAKPHEIKKQMRGDNRTAAVLMNHHYDTDRYALASLISFGLPYIAILGPKRRTLRILDELTSEGHDVGLLKDALHGPAGLDIGSETPEEIALAILAEIQAVLANREGGKLRHRQAIIHPEPPAIITCCIPV